MCIRDRDYLDSLANEKVYFGNWTLKQCREMEISLGLDLKGGMNVILEVSVPDVYKRQIITNGELSVTATIPYCLSA